MNYELSFMDCIKVIFTLLLIAGIILFIIINIDEIKSIFKNYELRNTEITLKNYNEIYKIINDNTNITLQEKTNFNQNYLIFGKKIIGYKVKDILKKIE